MQIWIDVDGVLTNTAAYILKTAGVEVPDPWPQYKRADDFFPKEYTANDFWNQHDSVEFWTSIPLLDGVQTCLTRFEGFCRAKKWQFGFLTAPQRRQPFYGGHGKLQWFHVYFPDYVPRVAILKNKALVAHPNAILIDDYPENCEAFDAAGGKSILWPAPWNERWADHRSSFEWKWERFVLPVLEGL